LWDLPKCSHDSRRILGTLREEKIVEIANEIDSGNGFELESGLLESSSEDNEEIPESSDYSSQSGCFFKGIRSVFHLLSPIL
jgi:hypothetical protein